MTKKINIVEALEFYHDNDLEEIISENPQNYFKQKDIVKKDIFKETLKRESNNLVQNIPAQNTPKIINSETQEHAKQEPKIIITPEEKPSFIKPAFSTSDALSTLAKKSQQNSVSDNSQKENQEFISLNNIVDRAKKIADDCKTLPELREALEKFDGCNLKKMATNTVFCDGNPDSKVMVIGEAPGNQEDLQGIPFCDDSGKLLDAMFRAIKMSREDFYVTNVIFWRPPGNRRPTTEELAICRPFVERHIQLVNPEVIVIVGSTSMNALTGINEPISSVRGKFMDFSPKFLSRSIKTFTIFHPSYLMRQTSKKKLAWMDMLNLEKFLQNL